MAAQDDPIVVAVSGGGDSIALMHLLRDYAESKKRPPPMVLTVDHGLRKHSARDAKQVAAWAKQAGLKAHVLTGRGAKPKTGVEAAARETRYRLMGDWLVKKKITTLQVGHTQDDQAETFLLRLARGSGLDGLSAMQPAAPWPVEGYALTVSRPLLGIARYDLRAHLTAQGQDWLEDPMNDDTAFDRVKIRKARAALADAGLTAARIAAAAAHLGRARAALDVVTEAVLARASRPVARGFALDPSALASAPREIGLRALAALLMAVSGQPYRPRFEALERLLGKIAAGTLGGGVTLHGCHIGPALRSARDFPPGTLLVVPENPRKSPKSAPRQQG
ncbi:MAG: tRNA(Ile)-lysidine synthase [Alphaproteobacteria bacterium]|nr:tRNA(Ile)-lysidine synthase [Alphaproteobacteria bacterium]